MRSVIVTKPPPKNIYIFVAHTHTKDNVPVENVNRRLRERRNGFIY